MNAPLPLSQWSAAQRAGIAGVITDIDDTLTEDGQVSPLALVALQALEQAGLPVLAVTGRPVGWSLPWLTGDAGRGLRPWPVRGIVAENGAVALSLGPDEWLLIARDGEEAGIAAKIEKALAKIPHALVDVSHRRCHDCLRLWVHLHQLLNLRILDCSHVRLDVRLVVLLNERLNRLARQQILVLQHRVYRHQVVFDRHQLGCILDTQHLDHLTVQQGQVVQLWG